MTTNTQHERQHIKTNTHIHYATLQITYMLYRYMLASTHPQCATNADTSIWMCAWCKGLCLTSDTRISYCDTKVHLTWCISSCGVAVHTTLRGGEQDWVRILLLHTNILLLLLKFHYDYKIKNQRYMYIWPNIGEAVDLIVNLCRDLLVTYTALGDV